MAGPSRLLPCTVFGRTSCWCHHSHGVEDPCCHSHYFPLCWLLLSRPSVIPSIPNMSLSSLLLHLTPRTLFSSSPLSLSSPLTPSVALANVWSSSAVTGVDFFRLAPWDSIWRCREVEFEENFLRLKPASASLVLAFEKSWKAETSSWAPKERSSI